MICRDVREELLPLFPDDLEPDECARVREHVAACAPCAAVAAAYAADLAARVACRMERSVPAGLLDGFADAVMRDAMRPAVAGRPDERSVTVPDERSVTVPDERSVTVPDERSAVVVPMPGRARVRFLIAAATGAAAAAVLVLALGRPGGPAGDPADAGRTPLAQGVRPTPAPRPLEAPVRPGAHDVPAVAVGSRGAAASPTFPPVGDRGTAAPARRLRDTLQRFFDDLDEVQVFPAGGGALRSERASERRVPYRDEATLLRAPGTEYMLHESEPAPQGSAARSVSF